MQHWSGQDSCPIIQRCSANQGHSMLVPLQLHPYRFPLHTVCSCATPMHCRTGQGKTAAQLFSAALQNRLTACLCHCNYIHRGFLFTQVCSDATPMHCRTGQGKTAVPLFSAALQTRLTACLCHRNYTQTVFIGANKFCDIISASTICLMMHVSSSVLLLRGCMVRHIFFAATEITLGSSVNL